MCLWGIVHYRCRSGMRHSICIFQYSRRAAVTLKPTFTPPSSCFQQDLLNLLLWHESERENGSRAPRRPSAPCTPSGTAFQSPARAQDASKSCSLSELEFIVLLSSLLAVWLTDYSSPPLPPSPYGSPSFHTSPRSLSCLEASVLFPFCDLCTLT